MWLTGRYNPRTFFVLFFCSGMPATWCHFLVRSFTLSNYSLVTFFLSTVIRIFSPDHKQ